MLDVLDAHSKLTGTDDARRVAELKVDVMFLKQE